jgi:hypothetical protein
MKIRITLPAFAIAACCAVFPVLYDQAPPAPVSEKWRPEDKER